MTAATLSPANLTLAQTLVEQLHGLLESEFELLRSATLDKLDELQGRKMLLLEQLSQVAPGHGLPDEQLDAQWMDFAQKARSCRQLHQRNEMLVTRKLEAVRGALTALQISGEGLVDETYDRRGRLSWTHARRQQPQSAYKDV